MKKSHKFLLFTILILMTLLLTFAACNELGNSETVNDVMTITAIKSEVSAAFNKLTVASDLAIDNERGVISFSVENDLSEITLSELTMASGTLTVTGLDGTPITTLTLNEGVNVFLLTATNGNLSFAYTLTITRKAAASSDPITDPEPTVDPEQQTAPEPTVDPEQQTAPEPTTDPTPTHTHTYSDIWSKDNDYHWHAATCEHTAEVKDKAAHDWQATFTHPATEESEGFIFYACTVCAATKTETLDKLPHVHTFAIDWSKDDVYHWHAATCEHKGEVDAKATHVWNSGVITKEATEEEIGEKSYTCTVCGEIKTSPIDKLPHTHTFGEWETHTVATCVAQGEERRYCAKCGDYESRTIKIDPTAHNLIHHDGQAATCTASGWVAYDTCTHCTYSTYRSISKLSHAEVVDPAVPATCSTTGLTQGKHCSRCGVIITAQKTVGIASNNHTFGAWILEEAATCTTDGIQYRRCTGCGKLENQTLPAKGHAGEWLILKEATCLETGTKKLNCSVCNKTIIETISKTGHPWSEWNILKEPSCGLGRRERTCTYCRLKETEITDADFNMNHSFDEQGVCTICGEHKGTQGLTYTIKNGTASVTGYTGSDCDVHIPAYYGGNRVTSINSLANQKIITTITLPDSVASIGYNAFRGCTGLTSITIPDSVTSIGGSAFSGCTGLTSITIPDSVTSIGDRAFYGCSGLTSITIPDSVTSIAMETFYDCSGLTSITIPDRVTSIGDRAFYGCSGLTSITIPDSVTEIGFFIVAGCSALESITIPFAGKVVDEGSRTEYYSFAYIFGVEENAQVPSSLRSVTVTKSINTTAAFRNCSTISSITIGSNVNQIPSSSFDNCTGLNSVTFAEGSHLRSIGQGAFYGCTRLTSITIPDSVTSIGTDAFYKCASLVCNNYGGSALYLGNKTNPYLCLLEAESTSITSCSIASSTTLIHSSAFKNCTRLTSITIPDSVTSIGSSAFYGCTGLTSVTIPNNVTSIENSAFYGCTGLTSITIPDSVTSIKYSAFYGCTGLTSITIPDSVTSIGGSAFYFCSGVTSVTIPSRVTRIEYRTFYNCTGLNSVAFAEGSHLRIIEQYAFHGCKGLTSITIPANVTSIAEGTFYGCSSLTSITIPANVTSIGCNAFRGCSSLTSITILANVTSIAEGAFYGCTGLTSVTIPNSVTSIEKAAFYGCSGLTSITIPNGVTSIGAYAFSGCSGLTSITIPDSVTSIGNNAFSSCSALTSIYYQGRKAQWNAISKYYDWNYNTGNYIVRCTDGSINK